MAGTAEQPGQWAAPDPAQRVTDAHKAQRQLVLAQAPSASWQRRAAALLLDALFIALLCLPAGAVLFMPLYGLGIAMAPPDLGMGGLAYALMWWFGGTIMLVVGLYGVWGDALGGTWGKRRLGLRVVRNDGRWLGWSRSALRQVVKLALLLSIGGALACLALADRRAWHDRACGARVVAVPEVLAD